MSATSALLVEAASRRGDAVAIEPEFGYVGAISRGSRTFRWRGGLFDLNSCGASALTRDKGYAFAQLLDADLPVPRTRTFFAPSFEAFARLRGTGAALRFAEELGYPVFVKPNEGTRAFGALRADDPDELCFALERSFARREGRVSLVQEFIAGDEWRFLAIDGRTHIAYRKQPLILHGDGQTPLSQLLSAAREAQLATHGRAFDLEDGRMWESLLRRGLRPDSRPEGAIPIADGQSLELGAGVEVFDEPPEAAASLAPRALAALGLRYGSVDAIERDGRFVIIEVNSAPGVTGLAARGHRERAIALYEAVLEAYFEGA